MKEHDLLKSLGITVGMPNLASESTRPFYLRSQSGGTDVVRKGLDTSFRERLESSLVVKAYGDESLKDSHGEMFHKDNDKKVQKLVSTASAMDDKEDREQDMDEEEEEIHAVPTIPVSKSQAELFIRASALDEVFNLVKGHGRPMLPVKPSKKAPRQEKDPLQSKQERQQKKEAMMLSDHPAGCRCDTCLRKAGPKKDYAQGLASANIREHMEHGHPGGNKQAIAIGISQARAGVREPSKTKKKSELDELFDLIKGEVPAASGQDFASLFEKSLFNDAKSTLTMKEYKPTKDALLSDLNWQLKQLQELKSASWIVESEIPEAKELAEKQFARLKKQIRDIISDYGRAAKALAPSICDLMKADDDKIIEMVPEKPVKNLAKLHENSPGMNPRNPMAKKKTNEALGAKELNLQKKSFIKAMGPGGAVFDFGPLTGNPIADNATALLNRHSDPIQASNAAYQNHSFDEAITKWAAKGEQAYTGQATPFGNIDSQWSKQLNKPMDRQVVEAFQKGHLANDPSAPAVRNDFNKTEISLGGQMIKATSETDALLIEMMKGQLEGMQSEGFVADASGGGAIKVTAGEPLPDIS